jgi:ABC-2 type transport system permease protein
MKNVWTIASREYKLYFNSPIAYAVMFLFLLILGWFFNVNLRDSILQAAFQPTVPGVEIIISPMVTLLLFTMPAITMRLISEEQRMGTLELLLTAPVRDWEVVLGKWLGSFLFMISLLAITWIYPIILNYLIDPGIDQGQLVAGYLGLVLMVASLTGIGVAISSFFANQIAAFFASLGFVLLIWLVRPASNAASGLGGEILSYLNYIDHYINFFRGIVDLSDVVYYLSITAFSILIGALSLETRRWR